MNILDILKNPFKTSGPLILDQTEQEQWPKKMAAYANIDADFASFCEDVQELGRKLTGATRKFSDDGILSAIPDRARTMNALHGNEYATQVQKLLKNAVFTDIFSFDRQQDSFFEGTNAFKDQTAKNASVLKEFLHDELKEVQSLLQQLEDRVIAFARTLDEKKFPLIRRAEDICMKIKQGDERGGKYGKLLASLQNDLQRTQEKRKKLEEDIASQHSLVRNEDSLHALEKVKLIDDQLHAIAVQYASVCTDAKAVYKKHELTQTAAVKKVLDELPKDPLAFLGQHAEKLKVVLSDIVQQLEDEQPGNTKTIIERLSRLSSSIEQDARTVQTAAPDQRALKREIMKDIAALNMYDKRQFLMRASSEEQAIAMKISYLTAELDPGKRIALEQELKDTVKAFGAQLQQ